MALALIPSYPDIQARAHVELGCVVGCNHLPDINDQQNLPYLPYLQSIVKVCVVAFIDVEPIRLLYVASAFDFLWAIGSRTLSQPVLAGYPSSKH